MVDDYGTSRTWRKDDVLSNLDELYGYDGVYRLDTMERGTLNGTQTAITDLKLKQEWGLDETGNWMNFDVDDTGAGSWTSQQTRTANKVNEITGITGGPATPQYDAAGNMTMIPGGGDNNWHTMTLEDWDEFTLTDWHTFQLAPDSQQMTAQYDAWNRLVQLSENETTTFKYHYDARGYRIRKDTYADGSVDEERHYYFSPSWQVLEERVGSSTDADRQHVWGLRYIDDIVLRDRDTTGDATLDERRYGLQDGNWNVIALSDDTGTVTERFNYTAYGVPTFMDAAGVDQGASETDWNVLYAGYQWDGAVTQMFHVRNRYLIPYIGTWNQRDPIGYADGTNLYEYVEQSPLSEVDPSGEQKLSKAIRSAGTAASLFYNPRYLTRFELLKNQPLLLGMIAKNPDATKTLAEMAFGDHTQFLPASRNLLGSSTKPTSSLPDDLFYVDIAEYRRSGGIVHEGEDICRSIQQTKRAGTEKLKARWLGNQNREPLHEFINRFKSAGRGHRMEALTSYIRGGEQEVALEGKVPPAAIHSKWMARARLGLKGLGHLVRLYDIYTTTEELKDAASESFTRQTPEPMIEQTNRTSGRLFGVAAGGFLGLRAGFPGVIVGGTIGGFGGEKAMCKCLDLAKSRATYEVDYERKWGRRPPSADKF